MAFQKSKFNRHTKSSFSEFQPPSKRCSGIDIDLIGLSPPSNCNIYCLVCIDHYTNWMEVVQLNNISADTFAKAFYDSLISIFRTECRIVMNHGAEFGWELLNILTKMCGMKLHHMIGYLSQVNEKVKCLHRTLKIVLNYNLAGSETLPTVLRGLRISMQENSTNTIAQMVYRQNIRLLGNFSTKAQFLRFPNNFAKQLKKWWKKWDKECVNKVRTKIFVPKDLKIMSHVCFQK